LSSETEELKPKKGGGEMEEGRIDKNLIKTKETGLLEAYSDLTHGESSFLWEPKEKPRNKDEMKIVGWRRR